MGLHLPPSIATLLTLGFIVYLFRRDFREKPNVTGALWIPLLWMFITFSRAPSEWFDILDLPHWPRSSNLEVGSPFDAAFFYGMIAAGLYVLNQRRVQIGEVIRNNQWLTIFFVYCLISVLWSDFPISAIKRWTKVVGHPVMALILLTEPDPIEAIVRLMKRCAYLVVPLSVLFLKYYPEWGRGFDPWDGSPTENGIAGDKTALGHDCLVFGLFFLWYLLQVWPTQKDRFRRNELLLIGVLGCMTLWLMSRAHSSTSSVCLVVGALTMAFIGFRFVNVRLIGTYVVIGVIAFIVLETCFNFSSHLIQFLGKDPTLTDRTKVWSDLLKMPNNELFGTGFESFWLGDRLRLIRGKYWWQPNQAHNGYLEIYLNLGLVGLGILLAWLVAVFRKIKWDLLRNFEFARLRFGFFIAILLYNWTEAAFKATSAMWFIFYIIAVDYRAFGFDSAETMVDSGEEEAELAYPAINSSAGARIEAG